MTGIVIQDGRLLVLDQDTGGPRRWSLPGGKVENGETLQEALVREMWEETGAKVQVGRLLYVCDNTDECVVHVTFEARVIGGEIGAVAEGADARPIRGVEFVALGDLPELGFSDLFVDLCRERFPGAGSYMGPKSAIGL
ncbi:NUDIX domain-containing protein [Streptomyces sp. NPDC058439]|uniref:NUDIX domain-containing protein n=1 Tax=Streptomyces sp. NPDC058439 TaxID=3346500 RepID=UPI00366394DB